MDIWTIFFYYQGNVHFKLILLGAAVKKENYLNVMRPLHEIIRKKTPRLLPRIQLLSFHNHRT